MSKDTETWLNGKGQVVEPKDATVLVVKRYSDNGKLEREIIYEISETDAKE